MINVIIAAVILATYTLGVYIGTGKIPNSLSQSVYDMPPWGRVLWMLTIGSVAFLIAPVLMDITTDVISQILAFLTYAGLAFVAATPLVTDKTEMAYKVHMSAAYTSISSSQLLVARGDVLLLLLWIPFLIALLVNIHERCQWPRRVFWAEITASVILALFILNHSC